MNSLAALALRSNGPRREAMVSGVVWLACLPAAVVTLQHTVALPARSLPAVTGVFLLVLILLVLLLPRYHPYRRFGAANRVTLARTALAVLLLGFFGADPQPVLAWCVVGIAALAACFDALDGPLARGQGMVSAFGARFDMEADAGLIMVLSLLAWQFEKAGAWVLAAGLMRYMFLLAGLWLPYLRASLPHSARRQTVCVVQVVILIVCLAPAVPVPWSAALAAIGLTALSVSFIIDIGWLAWMAREAR